MGALTDKWHGGIPTDHWHKFQDPTLADLAARAGMVGLVMGLTQLGATEVAYAAMARTFDATYNLNELAREGYTVPTGGLVAVGTNALKTTVASGSTGGNIVNIATWGASFGGNGVLDVASTTGAGTTGQACVATSTGYAVIAYTGKSSNTFTGCTLVSGTGTVSTGGAVNIGTIKLNPGYDEFDGMLTYVGGASGAVKDNIDLISASGVVDATNDRWVLIELTSANAVNLNIGTAAASPIMPAPTSGNVVHAFVYVPANAAAVDTSTSTNNGNAKIIDARTQQIRTAWGWVADITTTWTRSSNTVFTISSATSYVNRFTGGTKVRWSESGTVKYGQVSSVSFASSTTTVTLTSTSNTMAATPDVNSVFYSYSTPADFPATLGQNVYQVDLGSSPKSLPASTNTTVLTSATLPIGTYLVTATCHVGLSNAANVIYHVELVVGTATGTWLGTDPPGMEIFYAANMSLAEDTRSFSGVIKVTVAGTIVLNINPSTAATAAALDNAGRTSTQMICTKIA